MRKIEFDLTENESTPRYRFAGFEGEHNATLLTVLLPERMRKGNEAEYRFLFETAAGEAVFSVPLPLSEEGELSVLLTRSLMVAPELKAYVGCYVLEEGEPVLVAKSAEMVLGIQRSITDESGEMDCRGGEVPGLVIDDALSEQSRNPVENRVVSVALAEKATKADYNHLVPKVNAAADSANAAATYANQTAYRAQVAAQDAIQATADANTAATNAENSMLTDAYIDKDGVLFLKRKGKGDIYVGNVKGEKGEKGDPGVVDYSLVANAIKGKKSGEAVPLTDVSPLEHQMAVKVEGKNLIQYPYLKGSRTEKGITFTVNDDGTITANGTPTNYGGYFTEFSKAKVKANTTYFLSGCPSGGSGVSVQLYVTGVASAYDQGKGIAFTPSVDGEVIVHIAIRDGVVADNVVFRPQLEVGTTATAYTPFVDVSSVTLKKYGKNLLDCGTVTVDGYTTLQTSIPAGEYVISATVTTTDTDYNYSRMMFTLQSNASIFVSFNRDTRQSKPIVFAENVKSVTFFASVDVGSSSGDTATYADVQLEIGEATEYEPYVAPTEHSADENGKVSGVTSLYPTTTLIPDTEGVTIEAEYNRDTNKVIANLMEKIAALETAAAELI